MTGLKQLALLGSPLGFLTSPTLLQLTALTALEKLHLTPCSEGRYGSSLHDIKLQSKARCGGLSDVWVQLLHHLLRDAGCRQALLRCSCRATAAPAQLMLAQFAASLAEELAASLVWLIASLIITGMNPGLGADDLYNAPMICCWQTCLPASQFSASGTQHR